MKGFSTQPETIWGETLDVICAESDKAAARLRRAGVGATVRLTRKAIENGVTGRGDAAGVIVGWGNHKWTVSVRRTTQKTSSGYHVRFWTPVRKRRATR